MKHLYLRLITTVLLIISAKAGWAAEKFSLEEDNTYVGFSVSYLLLAEVSGRFDDFKGSFVIDHDNPENNHADIVIKTASVDTGIASRNEDIRSEELFDTKRFPTMVFHSNKIEMESDSTGRMEGDLTLRGVTKPVTLHFMKVYREDESFSDGFRVTGKIKRSDFGMNAFIRPIGNMVTLLVCYNIQDCGAKNMTSKSNKSSYNQ